MPGQMLRASSPSQLCTVQCSAELDEQRRETQPRIVSRTCDGVSATQQAQAGNGDQQRLHDGGLVAVTESKANGGLVAVTESKANARNMKTRKRNEPRTRSWECAKAYQSTTPSVNKQLAPNRTTRDQRVKTDTGNQAAAHTK
jgi:hypothetical protein